MTHLLKVLYEDETVCAAWENFCNKQALRSLRSLDNYSDLLIAELLKYGGHDIVDSQCIEFETEEQLLIFLLKYS